MTRMFKFVGDEKSIHAIAGGSLKFARIDDLNDPSELLPLMNRDAAIKSLATIRRDGYNKYQYKWLKCQYEILRLLAPEIMLVGFLENRDEASQKIRNPIFDNSDLMESELLRTIRLIRSRVGVLSLTERFDSLPMWAHYGRQARGYILCFDGLDQVFSGDRTGSLNALKPVKYVKNPVGLTFEPSTQDNLFFCKFKDWRYEREWRVLSALSSCDVCPAGDMYFRSFNPNALTAVICGWNVPEYSVRRLKDAFHHAGCGPTVLVASLSRGRVIVPSLSDLVPSTSNACS